MEEQKTNYKILSYEEFIKGRENSPRNLSDEKLLSIYKANKKIKRAADKIGNSGWRRLVNREIKSRRLLPEKNYCRF